MDAEQKKFLKHMSRCLTKGLNEEITKDKYLHAYYTAIVRDLPSGAELRQKLTDNSDICLQFFIKCVKKAFLKAKVCKNGSEPLLRAEESAALNRKQTFSSSLFLGGLPNQFPEWSARDIQALFVASQLQKERNLDRLGNYVKCWQMASANEECQPGHKYCKLLMLASGSTDIDVLKKIMQLYLQELQSQWEDIIGDKSKEKMAGIVEELKSFLQSCALRQSANKLDGSNSSYQDIMAALVSLYLDLYLACQSAEGVSKKEQGQLCSFVCFLLPNTLKRFDAILQITNSSAQNAVWLLPFLRKLFDAKPKHLGHAYYLRYVLALRMWSRLLPDLETTFKESHNIKAPKGFVKWLLDKNTALAEEFPSDEKFKGRWVTSFLLDDINDSIHNTLLDSLADIDVKLRSQDDDEKEVGSPDQEEKIVDQDRIKSSETEEESLSAKLLNKKKKKRHIRADEEHGDIFVIDRGVKTDIIVSSEKMSERKSTENKQGDTFEQPGAAVDEIKFHLDVEINDVGKEAQVFDLRDLCQTAGNMPDDLTSSQENHLAKTFAKCVKIGGEDNMISQHASREVCENNRIMLNSTTTSNIPDSGEKPSAKDGGSQRKRLKKDLQQTDETDGLWTVSDGQFFVDRSGVSSPFSQSTKLQVNAELLLPHKMTDRECRNSEGLAQSKFSQRCVDSCDEQLKKLKTTHPLSLDSSISHKLSESVHSLPDKTLVSSERKQKHANSKKSLGSVHTLLSKSMRSEKAMSPTSVEDNFQLFTEPESKKDSTLPFFTSSSSNLGKKVAGPNSIQEEKLSFSDDSKEFTMDFVPESEAEEVNDMSFTVPDLTVHSKKQSSFKKFTKSGHGQRIQAECHTIKDNTLGSVAENLTSNPFIDKITSRVMHTSQSSDLPKVSHEATDMQPDAITFAKDVSKDILSFAQKKMSIPKDILSQSGNQMNQNVSKIIVSPSNEKMCITEDDTSHEVSKSCSRGKSRIIQENIPTLQGGIALLEKSPAKRGRKSLVQAAEADQLVDQPKKSPVERKYTLLKPAGGGLLPVSECGSNLSNSKSKNIISETESLKSNRKISKSPNYKTPPRTRKRGSISSLSELDTLVKANTEKPDSISELETFVKANTEKRDSISEEKPKQRIDGGKTRARKGRSTSSVCDIDAFAKAKPEKNDPPLSESNEKNTPASKSLTNVRTLPQRISCIPLSKFDSRSSDYEASTFRTLRKRKSEVSVETEIIADHKNVNQTTKCHKKGEEPPITKESSRENSESKKQAPQNDDALEFYSDENTIETRSKSARKGYNLRKSSTVK